MNIPYLSILLPTKNRSHLVELAVRSVLQQDFHDFELIICDNDDDPLATKAALQEHLNSPNVKYIRTGGLSMIDNWNTALESSSGRYITVLEDKMIFYPGSLTKLPSKIEQSPTGVVVWGFDSIEDDYTPPRLKQARTTTDRVLQTDDVLASITKDIMGHWKILPRGLVSVIPRELVNIAKKRFGGNFYEPISPDFVAALKVFSLIDAYLLTSEVYTLVTSNKVSNGKSMLLRKEKDHGYMQGGGQLFFNLDLVPVKSTLIVANMLTIDYRSAVQSYKGKLENFPISHVDYLRMMTAELIQSAIFAKRIVWSQREIRELIFSENKPLANCFHIFTYALALIFNSLGKKLGVIRPETNVSIIELDQDPLHLIDKFLLGKAGISERGSFSPL